ncbi:hypothetical protein [Sediminibacterium sp. TEGAF015]|uniref:hypothetical protein n=1 Tax=Sediminibacterium sp. TEGAF015 TaxID=575378 RepID=UPI002200A57E|nr:hypothetical protein [Sediminibacterium sp. TEGAF015]BDQ10888.1 hypothetical protein TEGAF0_01050 [Sediminibacterium sp. TEGAF015]
MLKSLLSIFLLSCFIGQANAQKGNHQNPADIKKIQEFQKNITPAGKNSQVIHPSKSDGTPDMRYKANKEKFNAEATGPRKADGTPDLRYKENKTLLKSSTKKSVPKNH